MMFTCSFKEKQPMMGVRLEKGKCKPRSADS